MDRPSNPDLRDVTFSRVRPSLGLPFGSKPAAAAADGPVLTRPIPATGERLPMIGLGTAIVFDIGDGSRRSGPSGAASIEALAAGGGKVIDTAPAYGSAEPVVGDLVAETGLRDRLFLATKLGIQDRASSLAELQASLDRLKTRRPSISSSSGTCATRTRISPSCASGRRPGHCRYIGITTSVDRSQDALAATLKREKPDFVQVNYSINDREAEADVLPAAK